MTDHDPIQSLVRKVERRLTLQRRLVTSSQVFCAGLAVSLCLCIGMRLTGSADTWLTMAWLPFLGGLLAALAIHLGAIPRVSLGAAALHIDDRLHLNDRITTHVTVPADSSAFLDLVSTQALSGMRSKGREAHPRSLVRIVLPTTSLVMAVVCCLLAAPLVVMTRSPIESPASAAPGVDVSVGWGTATGAKPGTPPGSSPAPAADIASAAPPPGPGDSPRAQAQHLLQALAAGNIRVLEAKPQAARLQHDLASETGAPMDSGDQQLMDALQSILERAGSFREPGATSPGGDSAVPADDRGADDPTASPRAGDERGNSGSESGIAGPEERAVPSATLEKPRWAAAATFPDRSSKLPPSLARVIKFYFQRDDKE